MATLFRPKRKRPPPLNPPEHEGEDEAARGAFASSSAKKPRESEPDGGGGGGLASPADAPSGSARSPPSVPRQRPREDDKKKESSASRPLLSEERESRTSAILDAESSVVARRQPPVPAPAGVPACWASFADLGLSDPLAATCRSLGFRRPTPVQRSVIPFLLHNASSHLLALASTGSGKTAAYVLPILQRLSRDPYGVYAVVLAPTRELAKQIHQQVVALGSSAIGVRSALVVGGLDATRQSVEVGHRDPHFCVATPGRLAYLLRGPSPPRLQHARYLVLDEADRLLAAGSGFERDVAELLLHCSSSAAATSGSSSSGDGLARPRRQTGCQTLLFSATMTRSLDEVEEMAGAGMGRLPLTKIVVGDDLALDDRGEAKAKGRSQSERAEEGGASQDCDADSALTASSDSKDEEDDGDSRSLANGNINHPKVPAGLKQEYVFMPSRVRDAYLLATLRALMENGGRPKAAASTGPTKGRPGGGAGWNASSLGKSDTIGDGPPKARSAIVFVGTCERAAFVSGLLSEAGVDNVALHSLLSQGRRLASLGKFKSELVRVLVATDVASRGLDVPAVDLVVNAELPRSPVSYVHRVGRTARAGRRGRAVSLVAEGDIGLLHGAERASGRPLEKCQEVTDDMAIKLLGPAAKAARLAKMRLLDAGFDELAQRFKERKARDRADRERVGRALRRMEEGSVEDRKRAGKLE